MGEECYSSNGENFIDDIDSAIDGILNQCDNIDEAREAVLYIGVSVRPKISMKNYSEYIYEYISERLYEEVGEISENYTMPKIDSIKIDNFLQEYVDSINFNCYSVEKVRQEPITDHVSEEDLLGFLK